ncbi:hypothetical protein C2S51_029922 [Perilla frutescens var. frutescens]|nr:hypothetical protein C2S51_029922 [Perilla frutescens var. frutescens]
MSKTAGTRGEKAKDFIPKNMMEAIQQQFEKLFKTEMAALTKRLDNMEASMQEQTDRGDRGRGGREARVEDRRYPHIEREIGKYYGSEFEDYDEDDRYSAKVRVKVARRMEGATTEHRRSATRIQTRCKCALIQRGENHQRMRGPVIDAARPDRMRLDRACVALVLISNHRWVISFIYLQFVRVVKFGSRIPFSGLCGEMDVELVADGTSDDENFGFDDSSEDYLNYEGERCGICMDVVIDRGVLDCCQHWFCFACIDNWASITSLCPLCQNEFQLITCVPVHDTVGSTQTDDETNPRDDEWFIEGKTNNVSFPSYYIDENAVVCLDGDDCKIRSGSVEIREDSDIDTSIACDSCDKWYHAFCVGFDPEGTCEGSWLCPGCTVVKVPQMSDGTLVSRKNYQNGADIAGSDYLAEASFSGRVSVSVADDGETAVVISLVEGNQKSQESGESIVKCSKDMDNKVISGSTSNTLNSEALPDYRNNLEPDSCQQEMEVYLSRHNCHTAMHLVSPAELKICADDTVKRAPAYSNDKMIESGLGLDLAGMKNNDLSEDHVAGYLEANKRSEDLLPAVNMAANETKVFSMKSTMPDEKQTTRGTTGAKRKHRDRRNADHGEREANIEAKLPQKKIKAERDGQPISVTDRTAASFVDDSNTISEKENGTPDIMDIIQETDRRSLKQLGLKNSSDVNPEERETAAGLRLKKIMRRAGDNKDSSVLVQELRKKIREAVRNKSSEELGQNLFDPKLLDAFRAALAGSGAENRKPILDIKAKRSLLQKGKVRESLTKKIYGTGGKRKRAWTRECEVEFWKHRCMKASKPEKIQTLKSVLDLLRDGTDHTKKMPRDDQEPKGSILSRLYLADTSVFPRKNDIKPVSALKAGSTERASKSQLNNQSDISLQKQNTFSGVIVPPLESKETKNHPKGVKSEAASNDAQLKRHPKGTPPTTSFGGVKIPLGKDVASQPNSIKGDKRKWALELLARKTAASGKNMQEKEEDTVILKGNYPLLAQLPKDMRPILAPTRHNKIPAAVRQVQLYRMTEHFLKKANLLAVSQTAETELAVADAVNIEKDVANRSNSKLVYVNLCSQELSRRSEDINSDRATEANPSSTSGCPSAEASEEISNSSLDLLVDEALRKAGLMSDSPPNSPSHLTEDVDNRVGSPENSDEEPDNVIEVDSHPDLDIYGDFEYSLEDDDFFGAGALKNSKLESEPPKMKVLFSFLKPDKPNETLDLADHEVQRDVEPLAGPSDLLESQNKTNAGGSAAESRIQECVVQKSSDDNDEELSLAECEELYGPDIEPLIEKYPETASVMPFGPTVNNELDGRASEDHTNNIRASTDESNEPSSDAEKRENAETKEKTSKCDAKQSENHSMVMKKVETYIKEHIRPLCKSGVITVEQYRWAVGKTTEKVMKYHSKEKNANFLIKEGEKVKKLAEQYVEASQQKTKT